MKRICRLCFYAVYCLLAVFCTLIDFGAFRGRFDTNPFVYYTSLSNMACAAFLFLSFIHGLRRGGSDFAPRVKFAFTVMILITAIIYNLLLNDHSSLSSYFAAPKNGLYHLILPVFFFLDWLIFYDRGQVRAADPVFAVGIPLGYVIYILVRARAARFLGIPLRIRYPYFFLNVDTLGWDGLAKWMAILLVGVLALGYALYALDRLLRRRVKSTP